MNNHKESVIRRVLAQMPATKLFLKAGIDLAKRDMFQFKNSFFGAWETIACEAGRTFSNKRKVECNLCGWKGNKFFPHVTTAGIMREEKCPRCHSIPRYRTLMKFLIDDYNLFDKKLKVLEVGPNRSLQKMLLENPNFDYVSVDLKSPQAMYHMDVTDLKFEKNSFDLIFCISVMQYVENDSKGFEELFRVLKPGGDLIFASGIDESKEKSIEFERAAENNYTVRVYGWDVLEKLNAAGFKTEVFKPFEQSNDSDKKKYQLGKHSIFWLKK